MKQLSLYPAKAQFRPGEPVSLILESSCEDVVQGRLELVVMHLAQQVYTTSVPVRLPAERLARCVIPLATTFASREVAAVGYGVEGRWVNEGDGVHRVSEGDSGHSVSERDGGHPVSEGDSEGKSHGSTGLTGSSGLRKSPESDAPGLALSTAFDVAAHWRLAPRYGFLSDFHAEEQGKLQDVQSLLKYHLNVVQFYDWMYRHDELIPREDTFVDPMGRTLSYRVVQEKLAALHEKGMAAIAYGAVYAALADFHEAHPDWGLYKANGDPYELIKIFYLMDITPDSPWTDKIVSEFRRVIAEGGFDGIHMDQYGFPKHAFTRDADGTLSQTTVDLATCYPALIDRVKRELQQINPDVGLIFNNVSNYPVHTTATADQEAIYIEVWAPYDRYGDLKALIDRARELSGGKPVILAAYLHAFKEKETQTGETERGNAQTEDAEQGNTQTEGAENGVALRMKGLEDSEALHVEEAENGALLTMATIFASGGYHLALGEEQSVLTEAYYPDYRPLRPDFAEEVRHYYDFNVRYAELLYDKTLIDVSQVYTGGVNSELRLHHDTAVFHPSGGPGRVWTIVKRSPAGITIHLINLTGLASDNWNEGKPQRPTEISGIRLELVYEQQVATVHAASPDGDSQGMQVLPHTIEPSEEHGWKVVFTLPKLSVWSMIYVAYAQSKG